MKKSITFAIVALALVTSLTSCKKDKKAAKSAVAEKGANLLDGTDFNEEEYFGNCEADGVSFETSAEGMDGTNAMRVSSTEDYGDVIIALEDFYGAGKDYYFEGYFKVDPENTKEDDLTAYCSYTVITGDDYVNYRDEPWEIPGLYDGNDFMDPEEAAKLYPDYPVSVDAAVEIDGENWAKLSAIIPGSVIAKKLAGKKLGLQGIDFSFFVGTYPSQDGYIYLVDNVKIVDLKPELKREGATFVDPNPEYDEEDE